MGFGRRRSSCVNKKENWLRLIAHDHPGWVGPPWEAFAGNRFKNIFIDDPISQSMFSEELVYDTPRKDAWGVSWLWLTGSVAQNPYITAENKALRDVNTWRETVVFPKLDGFNWVPFREFVASIHPIGMNRRFEEKSGVVSIRIARTVISYRVSRISRLFSRRLKEYTLMS
jgi:hypothetical protein